MTRSLCQWVPQTDLELLGYVEKENSEQIHFSDDLEFRVSSKLAVQMLEGYVHLTYAGLLFSSIS
jgi:hypothetical protein